MDNLRTNAAPAGQFATKTHPHTPFTVLPSKLIQVTTTPTLLQMRELAGEPDLVHAFSTLELGSVGLKTSRDPDAVQQARRRFASELGLDPASLTTIGAVHGNRVA